MAPAAPEESGASVVGGKEGCEYQLLSILACWLICHLQLEEKKKLDQLRKEKEEERQLQELQRLQEEKTGKKRAEKLEWMYTTPATGSTQNSNDLEDYLLGKKRVDKILTADENAKVCAHRASILACLTDNLYSSVHPIRILLLYRMPIMFGISLPRSARTRFLLLNSRNRHRTRR